MKTYTIIGGVNGTGKSSLTGVLKAETTDLGQIIDVDKITASLGGNRLQGGKEAIARIEDCLQKGICFTQETTLSGQRTEKTARRARAQGYYIRLYYVGLDTSQESLKRIRNRVEKGGHDIPAPDVLKRFDSRFRDVQKILPYCDEATFFDNDNGFRAVGEYRNGEIIQIADQPPVWFSLLKEYLQK
ncbi:MAG TPA: hypothetical protein IAA58_07150 [Candidatus Gallacutalibacter stercoravium]|nr:hypothetical protein [Candidatus Gallacutalibacter stercoravium]